MYQLCAFDLDGTLVNTIYDIADAANYSLMQLGLEPHPYEAYYRFVGNGMRKICERALPEDKKQLTDAVMALYKERYYEHCCDSSKAYEGMHDLIKRLNNQGIRCAVASNKPHEQTVRVVEKYFGDLEFAAILGQKDDIAKKPARDMLDYVIENSGFHTKDTIYVGDSDVDVLFAHNAGVKCIGVSWGFRGSDELISAGADFIADSAAQIFDIACGKNVCSLK